MRIGMLVVLLASVGLLLAERRVPRALTQDFAIDLHGPRFVVAGTEVTFAVAVDTDDAPDDLAYQWDFGDGTAGSGQTAVHTYATAGVHDLRVTAASPSQPEIAGGDRETVTVADADPLVAGEGTSFPLRDGYGAGPFGAVEVSRDAEGNWVVFSRLEGARNSDHAYVVSLCRAEPDGAVQCVPTGTALGQRFCQTQPVNTGIVYCAHVDKLGNWSGTGLLQRFVYVDLGFEPNLALISYLQDGDDYYRADLSPDVPQQLQLSPMPAIPANDD